MDRFLSDTGAKTNSPPLPKKKRFTYVLHDSNDDKHCSGINCVKLGRSVEGTQKDFLFTGSRDGTVKRWQLGAHATAFGATFESHTDWVNDVVLAGTDTLVSCSSDTTLKTWRAFSNPECTRTFKQHSDYVMSLAVARHSNNIVVSGGLGCEVFLWDLEAAMTPIAGASTEGLEELITSDGNLTAGAVPRIGDRPTLAKSFLTAHQKAKGNKNSICAVSINEAGTTLVSGGMEKDIRVWDPRTGTKQMKLKGHTDNVRALVLDPAGRLCISGSSDSMIRLWDLGQQRCVHSYAVHTDSVWALAATPSFSHVYSGGRDKSVCETDLLTRDSTLLCLEEHPILQFELQEENSLWIATDNSSINKWPVGQKNLGKRPQRASSAGSSQFARDGSGPRELPLHSTPTAVIPGTPAIVRHIILNDHRHVLTKDGAGVVKMWEITRGTVINDYGAVSFEEKVKELSEMVGNNVPAWFTMDAKLGSISVHLDTPQCFSAEISAVDLLVPNATDELKLNLGRETLRGIFAHWLDRRRHQVVDHAPTPNPDGGKAEVTGKHGEKWLSWPKKAQLTHQSDNSHEQAENQQITVLPAFEFSTTSPPLIITEGSEGGPWRKRSTDLDGTEDEKELPLWCIECVLRGSPQTLPGNNATRSSVSQGYSDDTLDVLEKLTSVNLSTVGAPSQPERPQASTSEDSGRDFLSTVGAPSQPERPQASTLEDSDRDNFRIALPRLKSIVSLRSDQTDNFPISKQIELREDGDLDTDLRRPPQIQLQRVDRTPNSRDNVVIDIGFDDRKFRYDNKILGYGNNDETGLDNFSIQKCIRGFFKKMKMR